ncbi:hypothetical protein [Streptosporangium saharense]|uniref:Uncharacterized protein n=1 Tax=Streptosporangium saharense TaxID=1706840 RepID=A0A7W7VKW3_9ACTN|nr:hypothetical protein [Streptosporangium saharense]MBB4913799.1 hypothetical protein [Streptosporangium saharense]
MNLQDLRRQTEAALIAAGFDVRDDDTGFPVDTSSLNGACLFIQDNHVRLYLVVPTDRQEKAADIAAEALAGAGLRAVQVGADPASADGRTSNVLLAGTGELAEGRDPEDLFA